MKTPRACGTWPSSFNASHIASQSVGLGALCTDQGCIYWLEKRPAEKGRTTLMRHSATEGITELTPPPFNVASRVHEYGGGAFHVRDGHIVFTSRHDAGLWAISPHAPAPRLLYRSERFRFGGLCVARGGAFFVCIREDTAATPEAADALVLLTAHPEDAHMQVLFEGPDFLGAPVLSPSSQALAWTGWNHPFMPWQSSLLYSARLTSDKKGLSGLTTLAGHEREESVIEPVWESEHSLLALSDREGWWRPYRFDLTGHSPPTLLLHQQVETGNPPWVFGLRSYAPLPDGRLMAIIIHEGEARPVSIAHGGMAPLFPAHPEQCPATLDNDLFAWVDSPPDRPAAVVMGGAGAPPALIRASAPPPADRGDISIARSLHFPLEGGSGKGQAFFYPPTHAQFCPLPHERPPLVVMIHSGPTSRAGNAYAPKIQFWTNRGFAVLDVNYSGSTGFGRDYRQRLDHNWGVADVKDCIAACHEVIRQGLADAGRIVIRGSSAGGFTVLQALIQSDLFAGGTSLYGVSDLKGLVNDTHKFESRYMDSLIGPYPERKDLYDARSPLFHAASIKAPVLLLHGDSDPVVPLSQAEQMAQLLKEQGTPCRLHVFKGEGHGFSDEHTLRAALSLELEFYQEILALGLT